MKKIIILFLTGLAFFGFTQAQITQGGAGFLNLGYAVTPGSGSIFRQIAPDNISGFTDHHKLVGAELYYRKQKAIIALDGNLGFQKHHNSNNIYTEPYYGNVNLLFGWIISEKNKYWIYPSAGVGMSLLTLMTYNKRRGIAEDITYQTLIGSSVDLGINCDMLLSKTRWQEKFYLGSMLGIRAGYRAALCNSNWKDKNINKLDPLPSYANNAYYFTISIGWGSFDSK